MGEGAVPLELALDVFDELLGQLLLGGLREMRGFGECFAKSRSHDGDIIPAIGIEGQKVMARF